MYEGELSRLRRENSSLKDNLQRCLKELKAYQLKYPSAFVPVHPLSGDDLPPWITAADINSPLFEAYDASKRTYIYIIYVHDNELSYLLGIAELEEILKQQTAHLESFREKVLYTYTVLFPINILTR